MPRCWTGQPTWRKRDHGAELIRIDVRTTNLKLHAYYEGQRFTRCPDLRGLGDTPSQALFERQVDVPGSDFTKLFIAEEAQARHPANDRSFPIRDSRFWTKPPTR